MAVLCSIVVGCGMGAASSPSAPPATPPEQSTGPRVDYCGAALALDEFDLGLSTAPMSPRPDELIADVLLAADASGASIRSSPLTYAARLTGSVPETSRSGDELFAEASRSSDEGGRDCAGSIRMTLSGDVAAHGRGTAVIVATLGPDEVKAGAGFAYECDALTEEDGSLLVECPLAGVRHGTNVTTGILRVRMRWSGTPSVVPSPPGWAAELLAAAPTPRPTDPATEWTATVVGDHPAVTVDLEGSGHAGIYAEAGTIRYRVSLAVVHRPDLGDLVERPGFVHVSVSSYAGPGHYSAELIKGYVELRGDGGFDGPTYVRYRLADCEATIDADEATGRVACGIGQDHSGSSQPFVVTGALSVGWQTSTLIRDVGPAVSVTWRLAGAYASEGTASVHLAAVSWDVVRGYRVPDVRVGGTPADPVTLGVLIRPFMGDWTYTGDSVMASLEGRGEAAPGQDPRGLVDCQATIRGGGTSGDLHCRGGTTLEESWRVEP